VCVCVCVLDAAVKGHTASDSDSDDDEVILLSPQSVGGRMASTPVMDQPAAIDISDVISSIHGNLSCIYLLFHFCSVCSFFIVLFYSLIIL